MPVRRRRRLAGHAHAGGPATLRLRAQGAADPTGCSRRIDLWAWGPGAGWALERAPGLLGAADDDRW